MFFGSTNAIQTSVTKCHRKSTKKNMNPADILALLPVKPEDMPKIATIKNKPTRASIKAFQESIQDQSMPITARDHILGFLGMVPRASDFDPINNGNPFASPTDPIPTPVNAISTATQITEAVRLYKDDKENSAPTVNFALF